MQVDENMKTAQKRDAVRKEKFWFRKTSTQAANYLETLHPDDNFVNRIDASKGYDIFANNMTEGEEFELMSIGEIFNGKVSRNYEFLEVIQRFYKTYAYLII